MMSGKDWARQKGLEADRRKSRSFFCAATFILLFDSATAARSWRSSAIGYSIRHDHHMVMGFTDAPLPWQRLFLCFTDVPTVEITGFVKQCLLPAEFSAARQEMPACAKTVQSSQNRDRRARQKTALPLDECRGLGQRRISSRSRSGEKCRPWRRADLTHTPFLPRARAVLHALMPVPPARGA